MTWNLAYFKPSHYKTLENRRRQWSLLAELAPDIALLQECRPSDLPRLAPPWMAGAYDVVHSIPPRQSAGSAVLARKSFLPAPCDRASLPGTEQRWLAFLGGYVATAQLNLSGGVLNAASVHALAGDIDHESVTDADHAAIRGPSSARGRYNDMAAAALLPLTRSGSFVIGGDWNVALLFDANYPSTAPASAEFFEARARANWHHALRKFSEQEVRTYLDPQSDGYELDHLFTDQGLHEALSRCAVPGDPSLSQLSDHAPLIADFTDAHPAA